MSYLTEELVALDHRSRFRQWRFRDSCRTRSSYPSSFAARRKGRRRHSASGYDVGGGRSRAAEFDFIHVHIDHLHLPLFTYRHLPFLTTLHGRLDLPMLVPLFKRFPQARFVSISEAQREPVLPFVNWLGTVHHGLPERLLRLNSNPGGYLAFLEEFHRKRSGCRHWDC